MKKTFLSLVIASSILVGCSSTKEPSVVSAAPEPQPMAPSPAAAAEKEFVASGPIVVENQVDVEALREGVVASVLVQPGTMLRKGQLLAKLDDRQVSADLEAATAKVRALEANLENWRAEQQVLLADRTRAEKLYQAQVISKEVLDHAVYKEEADEFEIKRETESLNTAKQVQRSLELEKEKTNIVAPFDGVVARRYVRVGQKVAVGERLFWVTALGPLQVRFTLPETYYGKVRTGAPVTLNCADISADSKLGAKVVQVSPVIDPASGTMEVLAEVTDPKSPLRPGMLVNISLK